MVESEGKEVRAWIVWVGQNLPARMVFVLAQCTETICHYTSESKKKKKKSKKVLNLKTGTPCIVMCTCLNYWCPLTAPFPLGCTCAHTSVSRLSKRAGLLKLADLFAITCKLTLMSDKTLGEEEIPNDEKSKMTFSLQILRGCGWIERFCCPEAENVRDEGKLLQSERYFHINFWNSCRPGGNVYSFCCCCRAVTLFAFLIQCIMHLMGQFKLCPEALENKRRCVRTMLNHIIETLENKPN